jgi:hypothetical protein
MSIPGRVEAAVKGLALWAGVGMAVLATALAGLGFLIAGFFIWVERHQPRDAAAAITGGVLLAMAIIIGIGGNIVLRKIKKPQPGMLAEFGGLAGTAGRLAGILIRREPRKAVILAVIAGAVAEYITSGDKKKS